MQPSGGVKLEKFIDENGLWQYYCFQTFHIRIFFSLERYICRAGQVRLRRFNVHSLKLWCVVSRLRDQHQRMRLHLGGTWGHLGATWEALGGWFGWYFGFGGAKLAQVGSKNVKRTLTGGLWESKDGPGTTQYVLGTKGCEDAPRMRYVSSYAPAVPLGQHYRLKGKNSSVLIEVV